MYACVHAYIYICNIESIFLISVHYLIMKTKPSFVVISVFTADYQAD